MPTTKKTTKAVREAPTASLGMLRPGWPGYPGCEVDETARDEIEPTPRYTVELTTEGWQIKDNEKNNYGGDVYGSKARAQAEADAANRFETDWPR